MVNARDVQLVPEPPGARAGATAIKNTRRALDFETRLGGTPRRSQV